MGEIILTRMTKEEKEDRETERALEEFAKTVRKMKIKEWEEYKDIYPDLYKQEVGSKTPAHLALENLIDKMQDKIENLTHQNKLLKEEIRELKKIAKSKGKTNR